MESDFASLTLNEEEEEILQISSLPNSGREERELCLVGCFLTASVIHFPAMKSTMANLWHPIHDVPAGLFSEALAKQLGDFIGTFMEYDGANMGRGNSFCEARMALGVEIAEMGWDLSLRAQTRRARAQNNVWLREDDEGIRGGNPDGNKPFDYRSWGMTDKSKSGFFVDPILGLNLEGNLSTLSKKGGK
ncbi:hypothetical protein CXB51_035818 [Gossypium anomalum]|uniref:DUF4283 domain-containing protein n=1 Tax=Gossypium anomalum TaxID=47600 RepID=A0A8J5XYG5_9ROSI|nr:hypothetical protein CXB51_035818 [Gossypium anomalum]